MFDLDLNDCTEAYFVVFSIVQPGAVYYHDFYERGQGVNSNQ